MPYEITISRCFHATHAIALYDGRFERRHAHDWHVHVTVGAARLDRIDLVMDFHALEAIVDRVLAGLDGQDLNRVPPFAAPKGRGRTRLGGLAVNPAAERVAWWVGTQVACSLPRRARLVSVQVEEEPGCVATYRPR